MKNLKNYNVKSLHTSECIKINGGKKFPWNPFWLAVYVIEEIYDGLTRDCTSSCEA